MNYARERDESLGGGAISRHPESSMRRYADYVAVAVVVAFAVFGIATGAKAAPAAASVATQLHAEKAGRKTSPYLPAKATGRALEYYAAGGGVEGIAAKRATCNPTARRRCGTRTTSRSSTDRS